MDNPQFTFRNTRLDQEGSGFWHDRRETVRRRTLPYQLDVLRSTGRYDAFRLEWKETYADAPDIWPVPNHLFWDSDVAKWVEGACYFLEETESSEPAIRNAVEDLAQMIHSAQQPDGYLNIHFTVVEPDKRFSNIRDLHELYNAGHLIEAALAHKALTENDSLLQPLRRYTDLLCKEFGPGPQQRHAYPGHPEIELALLRLYRATSDQAYLDLARYFLEERGNPTGQDDRHYYDVEAEKRGERLFERPAYYPKARSYWYQQAHKPIAEQETIEGHSVRAMYLLTAAADLVHLSDASSTQALKAALFRLWDNMVEKKMYVTGGIGAIEQWEGFGIDHFLPQGTDEGGCYAETCAAIGVIMLAERLLQIELDGRFGDVMELCLYNAAVGGMSHDGCQFAYANQLASSEAHPCRREDWFRCACCPPNVTRLLGSLGGYLWTHRLTSASSPDTSGPDTSGPDTTTSSSAAPTHVAVNVHIYASATLTVPTAHGAVTLRQDSDMPWGGTTRFTLTHPAGVAVTLRLRVPAWGAEGFALDPAPPTHAVHAGYATLDAAYTRTHSSFALTLPVAPRFVAPHPAAGRALVALARGPLVYCVEDADNGWVDDHFRSLVVTRPNAAAVSETRAALAPGAGSGGVSGGVSGAISGDGFARLTLRDGAVRRPLPAAGVSAPAAALRDVQASEADEVVPELHFVPYHLRANRPGRGHMRVGLRLA